MADRFVIGDMKGHMKHKIRSTTCQPHVVIIIMSPLAQISLNVTANTLKDHTDVYNCNYRILNDYTKVTINNNERYCF